MRQDIARLALCLAIVAFAEQSCEAVVIDHSSIASVGSFSQATMDAIGQQTWFFSHASVGSNMMGGMNALHSADSNRYQLAGVTAGSGSSISDPPATIVAGSIYEAPRGNPGWSTKLTMFDNAMRTQLWASKVDFAMDKFCYIDQGASAQQYLNEMQLLEQDFPGTRFVYLTMPVMTSTDYDNALRGEYNRDVREFCVSNNRLLFDIADVESHDPSGNHLTFNYDGKTYDRLYSDYTYDGGHLGAAGQDRVALAWYALAATAVPEPSALFAVAALPLLLRRVRSRGSRPY